jgi:hypothetical protein
MFRVTDLIAVLIGSAPLVAFGYAANDLANGIAEAPQHWWSSAPLLGLAAAAALWAVPRLHRRIQT